MSQPNFPPARLFDAFAKPASTEQPAKKGLLGKLGLGESSEEDNYTTVMLVGFNSAKEPPGQRRGRPRRDSPRVRPVR